MRILQIIGALLLLVASPAISKEVAASWIVTQKSGDVRVLRNGVQPASVQLRAALAPGDVVTTGANGRAMLTKGEDYVVVAPASRLVLPKEQQQTGFTRLIQQLGTMLYKVKRTGVPHFAVETPMLAAVVKGTTFTVVVDENRAAVQVTEGIVEVSSAVGDARRLVEGGMTVYIGRERPNEILDVKSSTDLPRSSGAGGESVRVEGSGTVSLATIEDLSGGLVVASPEAPALPAADPITSPAIQPVPAAAILPVSDVISAPPAVIGEVVDTVDPALSGATDPVVDVVDNTLPEVIDPVVDVVDNTLPEVVDPVVDVVDNTLPDVIDPIVDVVDNTLPEVIDPVVDVVDNVLPEVVDPVVDIVDNMLPEVIDPVVEVVDNVLPDLVDPVVDVVDNLVPEVIDPVVDIVDNVIPGVTEPVVEIVDNVVPEVTEPVVEIVDNVVPGVTDPVVEIVDNVIPAVTDPVVEIVDDVVPEVTEPVVEIVEETVPEVTEPVVEVVDTVTDVVCILLCPR